MPFEILSHEQYLNINQQIDILKKLGISFAGKYSEDAAKSYLKDNNSFIRISSYLDSFEQDFSCENRHVKYEQLDFQQLVDLSIIDFRLREVLLQLILHIEHHLIIKINSLLRQQEIDPLLIVKEFDKNVCQHRSLEELMQNSASSDYSKSLYELTAPNTPVWVMLELLQLGELNSFISFLISKYTFPDSESILLADLSYELKSARALRNAAAHNSGILNGLLHKTKRRLSNRIYNLLIEAKNMNNEYIFSEDELTDENLSQAVKDITTSLYLHHDLVTSPGVKAIMAVRLHELKDRFSKRINHDPNKAVGFSLNFITRLIELWHPL